MDTPLPRIEDSIRRILKPHLKEDGFMGSGRTFRRVTDGWVQVVNIQGSIYGGQFAINLGIQPIEIPDATGKLVDPKKISQPQCEFRRRLTEGGEDQWWKHDGSQLGMDKAMEEASEVYVRIGRPLLAKVIAPTSPFRVISAAELISDKFDLLGFRTTAIRMALVFARLRKAEGKNDESRAFAAYGLGQIGHAVGLRSEFEKLSR